MKPRIPFTAAARALALGVGCWLLATSASAELKHRYSFMSDATDSVGGSHGTARNGVSFAGGAAYFSGAVASGPSCDYVELPPGLLSNYTSVTFEFWLDAGANGTWPELFAFGKQTSGGAGANMLMFCPHSGSAPNDYRMSYAQGSPGYTDEYVVNGVGVLDGLGPVSVTCVFDPPNNSMALYTNGALVALRSPVTSRFSLTNVHNVYSWLGRSLYNGDAAYTGTLDEFRIYNAALGPLQIAVNAKAGPDVVVGTIDVASISWSVQNTMTVGQQQDTTVTFNTVSYGSVTVSASTEAAYSSSDSSVISVDKYGRLLALKTGSATVSASYGTTTNSVAVTVGPPAIAHRYSFAANANDLVGNAHGTLVGSAYIDNGAVVLSGVGTSGAPDAYVDLPNNLLTNLSTVTVETWFTDNGSGTWARVWDLGNSNGGEDVADTGSRYMFLTLPNGGGALQGNIHLNDRAGGDFSVTWAGGRPPVGKASHVVWITSIAAQRAWLYVDGTLVGQTEGVTLKPSDLGPTVNNWLGRSQYGGDAMFNGVIDEFRIWNGAMTPLQVAIDAASGPNSLVTDPGAVQSVKLTVSPEMVVGGRQNAVVKADFANVTGVTITSVGATYTSGNEDVITVDANGLVTAVGLGSTTLTTTYEGKSDTQPITVVVKPTVLAHRYNFNETSGTTAKDLVGTADATLQGGASFADGAVLTDGISGYVDLPADVIKGFDAVTVETWVTVDPNTLNDSNGRLFLFGSADGVNELGLTARTGGHNTYLRFFGPPNVVTLRNGTLAQGGKYHLAAVFNAPLGVIELFLNGIWQNAVTNLNFSITQVTNSFSRLAANIGLTSYTAAQFDEFRIYNGAMTLAEIRTSRAAGPNNPVFSLGTPTSVSLAVDAGMVQGSQQTPRVVASSAAVANVDLTGTGVPTFSSSDANVIVVTPEGRLQAVGAGSATITVTLGGQTDSEAVTVYPKQPMLVHRYSFTADASDSVGTQHGVFWGNAYIFDGGVVLDGEKSSYVQLPGRLISSLDAVTLETWVNLNPTLGDWCRLFDIGSQNSDANGTTYVFLSPHVGGGGASRVCLKDAGAEAWIDFGLALDGFIGSIAVVYDPPTNLMSVYTNGVLALTGSLAGKVLAGVNDINTWLGKSMYYGDSGLIGSIDEFRIYAGALNATQLAASHAAGPSTVALPPPVASGPRMSVSLSGSNLTITWPGSATGYALQSTGNLGPTTPSWSTLSVSPELVGGQWQVQVPLGAQPAFYRLAK